MEILKRGSVPLSTARYEGRCEHCGTEIRFFGHEAKFDTYPGNGRCAWHLCPLCRARIIVPTRMVNKPLPRESDKG